jgi:hypothetical protein
MIDTDKYEEIMKHDWLFEEQLFVGGGKWRFALTEYTDLIDMSERDIEEWEEGLEPIWEALVNFVADAPLLLEEVKRLREANRSLFLQLSDVQGQLNRIHRGEEE